MNAYALHQSGDCGDGCPVCRETCETCGRVGLPCECPPTEETE